jgi:predicted short-subunit dehydrogenase-like oxidoreductase (DUF2520 family)
MKITLIGSGNVAWNFAQVLTQKGHQLEAVYSRSLTNARMLADQYSGCKALDTLALAQSSSSLFVIAVADQALESVCAALELPPEALVVHTSGSMPMAVLQKFDRHGVFYPLQTFSKDKKVDFSSVPLGIEASDDLVYEQLTALARSISNKVYPISSQQRTILHIAAVFACNYSNYMMHVAGQILEKEEMQLDWLKPLVEETVAKAFLLGPAKAQTGPAIRGDEAVLQKHLQYLADRPDWQDLYQLLADHIRAEKK